LQIVADVQNSTVFRANSLGAISGNMRAASGAFKESDSCHEKSVTGKQEQQPGWLEPASYL
jgi:hypothetical protein